ncbi:MAG TPA: outer membrane beta-barrel family protein [Mucilaginibacter sp.]|jgi:outer membrane receptor protein involved in Fe transport
MKRFYILIAILCSFVTANAQFGVGGGGSSIVGKISGTLIDSLTKKPMDYASVGLYHSGGKSPITGVITDEKGNFKLDNIHPGSYKLLITFIGYPNKTIDPIVTTGEKPDKNLGSILVSPGAKVLKEVVVEGQAALIENKIDKIVYNAEKDITAAGGTATDLLGKVPLVAVDMNGNVSIRGDQNVRVLINGKPSGATSSSLSDVLKAIPADQIKSIEVITSPSAKYDAEGSAGIINIITKQKNVSGVSGSISGGIGTRQNNGNANFNYNKNRFNFSANLGGNASWPQTSLTDFKQQISNDTIQASSESKGTSVLKRHAAIGSLTAGYQFNSFNNITSTFRFNQIEFNTTGSTTTTGTTNYSSDNTTHNQIDGFDWSLDYTHKFKKEGHEIDLSTQWSHNDGTTDYSNLYTAIYPSVKNNIVGVNNEYTVQLDYTLPINKVFKLEAGGKTIFRRISSTSDFYNLDNTGQYVFNPANSNIYYYNQDVVAGYSVFTITLPKKYTVLAGLRDENTDIHGDPINDTQNLQPFSQDYNTVVPSLTVQKQLNASQTIKLAYSKRLTRPSLQYLNPFVNVSNVQNGTVGDPTLQPEISQTLEFDYNSFIKTSILNFSVYYKHTQNLIEGIAGPGTYTDINGVVHSATITQSQNIGDNNSFGGSFFGTINPFKALTIIGNVNAFTYNPNPNGAFKDQQSQNGTYIQYGGFLRGTLTLPANYVVEAFAFGSSARHTIQGTTPTFSIFGIGAKKQFMQKKMSIGINAIDPFNKYKSFDSKLSGPGFTQSSSFQLPFRSIGLTFGYSFGKLTFSNPQQKKGVNNDDMKQGDQGVGGGGGTPSGGGR